MKTIYLIRHGKPAFPNEKHMCLGRTDLPLCDEGYAQARAAAECLRGREFEVFSSPLLRSIQTAEAFNRPITVIEDLQELYAGQWDGLSFDEIKVRFPVLYEARGHDRSLPLPGAEDHAGGLERFRAAIITAAELSAGDLAVIAHGGVIELLLHELDATLQKPAYGQIICLRYENRKFELTGGTQLCVN